MNVSKSRHNAQATPPLISAQELHSKLTLPDVKLFDVRGAWGSPPFHEEYLAGHIPGAIFLDWTQEFLQQEVAIPLASVATADAATRSFRDLGIDPDDTVVVYDDSHHVLACRIWWAMRYWGFDKVRVLNGGWSYWLAQGLPTAIGASEPSSKGSFQVERPDATLRIDLADFIEQKDSACLLDARSAQAHRGSPGDPRSGHIPGAINLPYTELLHHATGLFLDADALAAVFEARLGNAAPNWSDSQIISSCGSGYGGTVLMLALQALGTTSQLFDGSFALWKEDPSREVSQS